MKNPKIERLKFIADVGPQLIVTCLLIFVFAALGLALVIIPHHGELVVNLMLVALGIDLIMVAYFIANS